MNNNQVLIGVLGKVIGLRGVQRFYTNSNFVKDLKLPIKVSLKREGVLDTVLSIDTFTKSSNFFLLSFCKVKNREKLQSFVGARLYLSSKDLPKLEGEEYYVDDLIGFQAVGEDAQKISWYLKEVRNYPANDVFVFSDNTKVFLIPFVSKHIGKINILDKTIELINWKEWLEI